ncbi:protein Pry1p [Monosporozyma servazzii]
MQFSKKTLLAATLASSTVLAAPAAVTVTEHAHQVATVTVHGVEYVTDGVTKTSYVTIGGQAKPTVSAVAQNIVNAAPTTTAAPMTPTTQDQGRIESIKSLFSKFKKGQYQATVAKATVAKATVAKATQAAPTTQAVQTTKADEKTTIEQPTTTLTPTTTSPKAAPTTTSPKATPTQKTDSNLSDFASTMLNAHNSKRALHKDTSSLSWSDELASYAQNYADNFDCSGNLQHSGGPYGENLALGYDASGAVDAWYDEISDYDFANPGFSSNAGHFSQLVWKGTSKLGCGIKTCDNAWGHYVICSYQDAGNVGGQYADNVMPLL